MTKSEQTLSIRSGYVLVERPPDYEVIRSEQSTRLAEISALCEEAGIRNVLVVGPRTSVKLSTTDIFSLGEQIAQLGLRVAVVELHNATDGDVSFLENVSTNRGGPMEFFNNEQDAKDWLGVE